LPTFVSRILAEQPLAPRRVPFLGVAGAVLAGLDCAIYAAGSLILIAFGLSLMSHAVPSSTPSSDVPTGWVIAALGALSGSLTVFRIWQVDRAMRQGDALMAEVVEAEVGRARFYGTPWGEPMGSGLQPVAARGAYRLDSTGEIGCYYLQQRWAAALRPGDRIWVLRSKGRDVLYAPVNLPG
jgi:hypothetical protein